MASALFKEDLFLLRERECSPTLTEDACTVHVPDAVGCQKRAPDPEPEVQVGTRSSAKAGCALSQRLSHPPLRLHTLFIAFLTKRFGKYHICALHPDRWLTSLTRCFTRGLPCQANGLPLSHTPAGLITDKVGRPHTL